MSHAAAKSVRVRLRTHPDYQPPKPHLRMIQGGPLPRTDDERRLTRSQAADLEYIWVRESRLDPNAFAEYAFGFRQAWFHELWHQAMDTHSRVAIRTPRGTGKTEQGAIVRTIYELGRDPDLAFGIVGSTDGRAVERVKVIRDHIERNPQVHKVFPWLRLERDQGSKHAFTVVRRHIRKDASVEAIGIGGSAAGGRKNRIVGDDVCNARNALLNPALRAQVKLSWNGDIVPLLLPGGKIWFLHTGWHRSDLGSDIISNPEYHVVRMAVGANYEAPWPETMNSRQYYHRRREMGLTEYNRAYRDIISDISDAAIHPEWVQYVDLDDLDLSGLEWVLVYDVATGDAKSEGSYFACSVFAVLPAMRMAVVYDSYRMQISIPDQEHQICRDWDQFSSTGVPVTTVIESIGGFVGVPQHVRLMRPGMTIVAEKKVTGDKVRRLKMQSPLIENGVVRFADELDPQNLIDPERGDLISDILDFENCRFKDMGDTLSAGCKYVGRAFKLLGVEEQDDDGTVEVLVAGW